MTVDVGLPIPTTMLFSRPIRGLLHQMNREPIDVNNDETHYDALSKEIYIIGLSIEI